MPPSLDIIVPVLDEEYCLETKVTELLEFIENLSESGFYYRVTIADNGSRDNTFEIAKCLADRFQNVKVVSVPSKGVGLALKTAWRDSDCDFLGYMDLDLSTDLSHLKDLESLFNKGYECVFGSRLLPESKVSGRSLKRTVTSIVFNKIIQKTFHSKISDGMCGFKFMSRNLAIKLMQSGADCDGWFFCTELTVVAQNLGCNFSEIPIKWIDENTSKVKIPSLTYEYFKDIIKLKIRLRKIKLQRLHL
jgi:glycosyltransferase involved in cell wall biosynthesis